MLREINKILTPSENCIFCNQKISDIGGQRITEQKLRGLKLSTEFKGGGNKKYPYQSVKLDDVSNKYLVVWGEKDKWSKTTLQRAHNELLNGRQPWFCQVCGECTCKKCGHPTNSAGSDTLLDNGSIDKPPGPFVPGCINSHCEYYIEKRTWKVFSPNQ
tara:strand:- start:530 stop:1006 length:477 start_codon:yes stop_codon:yes gene_type:complete